MDDHRPTIFVESVGEIFTDEASPYAHLPIECARSWMPGSRVFQGTFHVFGQSIFNGNAPLRAASFSRTLGWFVCLALIVACLVELLVRYSWTGIELSAMWIVPLRLIAWMTFILVVVAWVVHGFNPPSPSTPDVVVEEVIAPIVQGIPVETPAIEESKQTETRVHFVSPCFASPEPIIGRTRQREKLTEWFRSAKTSILTLSGRGGMGKTTLAWLWIHHDVLSQPLEGQPADSKSISRSCHLPVDQRPQNLFWASFEDGTPSFLMLLDELTDFWQGIRRPP